MDQKFGKNAMSFILLMFLYMNLSFASSIIQDIDFGEHNEPILIFFSDGRVMRQNKGEAFQGQDILNGLQDKSYKPTSRLTESEYYKTILEKQDDAESLFSSGRRDFLSESQCYQRAHIWAYEWRKKGIYTSKVWLFFSKRYIRKYNFDWWFHVAPSVLVNTNDGIKERILDLKYGHSQMKLKDWTDIFIRDSSDCPVVQNYTDQADNPESSSCYIIKSSMYYYQPYELELKEINGIEKTIWSKEEVRKSYLEAFNIIL